METKKGHPSPLDLSNGFYASLINLSQKVTMLQDKLEDVLGLRESAAVWKNNVALDTKLRDRTSANVDDYMSTHSQEETAEFLKKGLMAYYTRRIALGEALSKVGDVVPTSKCINLMVKPSGKNQVELDLDTVKDMRVQIANMSDIHKVLTNLLKGHVDDDAVEDKSLVDSQYMADVANDATLPPHKAMANAYGRFKAIMTEISSAERQVNKLKERVDSYANSPEAKAEKAKLKEMEKALKEAVEDSERGEDSAKLSRLLDYQAENFPKGSQSERAKKLDAEIKELKKRISERSNSPEIMKMRDEVKAQRAKVASFAKSPEAQAAAVLVDKRREAVKTLQMRLVSEAERFCKTRDEMLKSIAKATKEIAGMANDLPQPVRDVFRRHPPACAEEIESKSDQIAFSRKHQ